jgi:ATP-dependent Clp endopeptidase proteolytic subunit ClpP
VETICLGTAFGTAAMLLANGKKGTRSCLPNSVIMLHQPRGQAQGQASDIKINVRRTALRPRRPPPSPPSALAALRPRVHPLRVPARF